MQAPVYPGEVPGGEGQIPMVSLIMMAVPHNIDIPYAVSTPGDLLEHLCQLSDGIFHIHVHCK